MVTCGGHAVPEGMLHYFSFLLCLSDSCVQSFLLECLWLKECLSPKSLLLGFDFFDVAAAVFFLVHSLWCRLMCELTWELVGGSVWESCCELNG